MHMFVNMFFNLSRYGLVSQGQISDVMMIADPTFAEKVANFTNSGQGLSQKVGFFFIFEPVLLAFLTKCWLFQTRNPPLSLFLAFLAVVFSQFCSNIIEKVAFN